MKTHHFRGLSARGFHKVVYSEWGDSANPRVVVCAHGLTRNRHSFDYLAKVLCENYRVICPDLIGRGDSDFIGDSSIYNYPQYLSDMNALLARLNVPYVHWVGTSMGGVMGMMLANLPNTPIKSLLLNDIGYRIPAPGVQRILRETNDKTVFASKEEAMAAVKLYFQSEYGELDQKTWEEILSHNVRFDPSTHKWQRAYDLFILEDAIKAIDSVGEWNIEPHWKDVSCDCLILRGAESDILEAEVAQKMADEKEKTRLITFKGFRHALPLVHPHEIKAVVEWLGACAA